MPPDWIEVTVRVVQAPVATGDPTTVLVGPCERGDLPPLQININAADAALLEEVLCGGSTGQSSALSLVRRIATALGTQVTAAYLIADGPELARGFLKLRTPDGRLDIPIRAGQALVAAAGLDIGLLADRAHFSSGYVCNEPTI